jgi:N-acetylglutamate synthase-like GNAT family acetyltransferase
MIRRCTDRDFADILAIVNDAARAYRGVIPADCWHEPYMPRDALRAEIAAGVAFHGYREAGRLLGVMGVQPVRDVVLIRHAYVRTASRRRGIGGRLLEHIRSGAGPPLLVGTWAAADWAIRFYHGHGFEPVPRDAIPALLRRYWDIPQRQIETSVVLAEKRWFKRRAYAPISRDDRNREDGGTPG